MIDVGSFGRSNDGGIFSHSAPGKRLENGSLNILPGSCLPGTNIEAPFVIIGYEAFPLTLNIPRGVLRGPHLVRYWLTSVEINKHKTFDINNA